MIKCFAIHDPQTHRYIGTIVAEYIQKDSISKTLMFMKDNQAVAMFRASNIEISTPESRVNQEKFTNFVEYESNRISFEDSKYSDAEKAFDDNTSDLVEDYKYSEEEKVWHISKKNRG